MLRVEIKEGERWLVSEEPIVRLLAFGNFHDKYAGNVFILASGPSVVEFPLNQYAVHPVVAMNGSIRRCIEEGVSPLFYLCDDASFVRDRPDIAMQGILRSQNIAMSLAALEEIYKINAGCLVGRSVFLLERVNRFLSRPVLSDRAYAWSVRNDADIVSKFSLFRKKPNRVGFSRNMEKGYFVARTIPYVALQMAYYLGFNKAFLVGVDLRQAAGRFYESGAAALPSTIDRDYVDYILPSFRVLANKITEVGKFEVFNLSKNSRIPTEIIPKCDLEMLDKLLN